MKLRFSIILILIQFIYLPAQNSRIYKHPEWSYNKTIYEANIRQYSTEGTFALFQKHLPELKKMGVGIIWLMPVNPIGEKNRKGTLGSYYAVQDYLKINPEFGTKEDFKDLVNAIHKEGMYVIIDWVANHTSWDNNLTVEHPDWFMKDSSGNFVPPNTSWTDVIDLNYDNAGLCNYMTDALKYWVKEFDIDGYRCDVAEMVPLDFWIKVRKELDKIKPVFMLAEGEKAVLHSAFDMTYSWQTLSIMKDIVKGKVSTKNLDEFILRESERYPADAFRMRFTTNHDENSWNGTDRELFGEGHETFAAVISFIPGMPLLYSGQEAGLDKRLKFFESDPIEWKKDRMRDVYTKLFNLKKNSKVLLNGEKGGEYFPVDESDSLVYSFIRKKGDNKIFAIFNFTGQKKKVSVQNNEIQGSYMELISGKNQRLENKQFFELNPWEYRIYVK